MKSDLVIPRPVQLVIDDVGWREGWDLSAEGGPFRAGVERLLGPPDLAAIADIGEVLGIRPQAAMVLCEWDRRDVCARFSTTTYCGHAWTNRDRIGPWLEESASLFRERSAHIEFALHGVGHEHWEDGTRTRAEWFGQHASDRWPPEILRGHWECFLEIMADNGLGPDQGISPPRSFVPCAFRFLWNNSDPHSTGALMTEFGIRYASTPFSTCTFVDDRPEFSDGGFEHGIVVLDRGHSGIPWHAYDTVPGRFPDTSICGIHWPNLLRPDPAENPHSAAAWAAWLRDVEHQSGVMLGRSMAQTVSQWLWCRGARLRRIADNEWTLDVAGLPARARGLGLVQPVVLELSWPPDRAEPAVDITGGRWLGRWRREDHVYLTVAPSDAKTPIGVRLRPEGTTGLPPLVTACGTCDLLDIRRHGAAVDVQLTVYGTQSTALLLPFQPRRIERVGGSAELAAWDYDEAAGTVRLDVFGHDLQGQSLVVSCLGD